MPEEPALPQDNSMVAWLNAKGGTIPQMLYLFGYFYLFDFDSAFLPKRHWKLSKCYTCSSRVSNGRTLLHCNVQAQHWATTEPPQPSELVTVNLLGDRVPKLQSKTHLFIAKCQMTMTTGHLSLQCLLCPTATGRAQSPLWGSILVKIQAGSG